MPPKQEGKAPVERFDLAKLDELVQLLNFNDPEVRQGAVLGILKKLAADTLLSKSDLRNVGRKLAPVVVQQQAAAKPAAKKGTSSSDGPLASAVKADVQKYPLDQRGKDSSFAVELRKARAQDKANKA